ncbi:hypothetical protein like AT4G27810 [Hibiscus trionum]|uniref:Uncharacterized protein n=1 Tax=Hibiscus trionum TaxID=183268 RepID=A0A9W7MGA6_HIBTR|nr:hypothetical protein like AT4G27810 [Hibiscus trionum]
MGFEHESEKESPRLPLFSSPHAHMVSPERPGTLTPPLRSSASVPFLWEEEPGKPKACATVSPFPDNFARKCLELPPRLQEANKNNNKVCSPTTVLDGPYMGRTRFQSSSFRMVKSERYGSFRGPENMVPERVEREKDGFHGSRRRSDGGGKSYVFPSYGEEYNSSSVNIRRMNKCGSLNSRSLSKSHFWASIYEGLKQVVPWSKREKKDRYMGADFLIKQPYR